MKGLMHFVFAVLSILGARVACAAEAAPTRLDEARTLYKQGQSAYDLGDYERAIKSFSQSYELSNAPGLLYNIAQSYRLKGDCRHALEEYRHFLRLAPASRQAIEAASFVSELEKVCSIEAKRPEPAPLLPNVAPANTLTANPVEIRAAAPAKPRYRWVPTAAMGMGAVLGLTGYVLHLENTSDYRTWLDQNDQLSRGPKLGESARAFQDRQDDNDNRLRHIEGRDTLVAAFALGATAMILTAVVTSILSK